MKKRPYTYLFRISYLGLGYKGWQKQKETKTIQGKVERALNYLLPEHDLMTLGAGRTDSGVSCRHGAFELFSSQVLDPGVLVEEMNQQLPVDIRILSGEEVPATFNIIQDIRQKEYRYYFTEEKNLNPLAAQGVYRQAGPLDIEAMQEGLQVLQGTHNFKAFCSAQKKVGVFERHLEAAVLEEEPLWNNSFGEEKVYSMRFRAKGFLRYQVRIMAAALLRLAAGELKPSDLKAALAHGEAPICYPAPAQALVLYEVEFV